jgi:hypothetical protein
MKVGKGLISLGLDRESDIRSAPKRRAGLGKKQATKLKPEAFAVIIAGAEKATANVLDSLGFAVKPISDQVKEQLLLVIRADRG